MNKSIDQLFQQRDALADEQRKAIGVNVPCQVRVVVQHESDTPAAKAGGAQ